MEPGPVNQPATRFFPFAKDDEQRLPDLRDPPDADDQARAARSTRSKTSRLLEARPLWWVPLIAAALVWQHVLPLWAGIAVAVLAVLVIRQLYRAARRHALAVRAADETIGIPVPPDLGESLCTASRELELVIALIEDAVEEAELAHIVGAGDPHVRIDRSIRNDVHRLDLNYVQKLHDIRIAWAEGDAEGWRRAAEDAAGFETATSALLNRTLMDQLLGDVLDKLRKPRPGGPR